MKKFLTVASVLLISNQVYAQNNVSISGGIMTGIKHTAEKKNGLASSTKMENLGVPANHITFKSSEKINDDLLVEALLNHRFNPDDGSVNGSSFFTNSKLSLSSSYGSISLGKFWAPVDWILRPTFDVYGPFGIGGVYGAMLDAPSRYNGMMMYESPASKNFKFAVMYVSKDNMLSKNSDVYEAAIRYKLSNFHIGAGYTKNAGKTPSAVDNVKGKDVLTLAGGVDLKSWKVGFTYTGVKRHANVSGSERYSLGIRKKFNDKLTIKSGYEHHKIDFSDKTRGFALGAEYALSRRTGVFSEIGKIRSDNLSKSDVGFSYTIGMQHRF